MPDPIEVLRAEVLDLRKKLHAQQAATAKWMNIAHKAKARP